MFKFIKTIEVTEEEIKLLQRCYTQNYLEYRDNASTYQEHVKKHGEDDMAEEVFNRRNEGGTWDIAMSLVNKGLLDSDEMAWHDTYKLTDEGLDCLQSFDNQ